MARNPISGTANGEFIKTTIRGDIVTALEGNDTIQANDGSNIYDGGDGFDYLDYSLKTGTGSTATQGITIDFQAGTVLNAWGKIDRLISIDWITGSQLADTYNFADRTGFQVGEGRQGADQFNSSVGATGVWLIYRNDAANGGGSGISVRLGAVHNGSGDVLGQVTDSFGFVDTTTNVRRVEGTQFADTFVGSRLNDQFNGLDGADTYDGRRGTDFLLLDTFGGQTQLFGVRVDLAKNGGEVINDGLGNTETATSMEGVRGSKMDDTIRGDAFANYICGDEGIDLLVGRGGADFFVFGNFNSGAGFGDRIVDFVSGVDMIVLSDQVPGIVGGGAVRFSNGAVAGSASQLCFFFDGATQELFMDADGRDGAEAAVMIARLDGVTAMTASDIELVVLRDFWN